MAPIAALDQVAPSARRELQRNCWGSCLLGVGPPPPPPKGRGRPAGAKPPPLPPRSVVQQADPLHRRNNEFLAETVTGTILLLLILYCCCGNFIRSTWDVIGCMCQCCCSLLCKSRPAEEGGDQPGAYAPLGDDAALPEKMPRADGPRAKMKALSQKTVASPSPPAAPEPASPTFYPPGYMDSNPQQYPQYPLPGQSPMEQVAMPVADPVVYPQAHPVYPTAIAQPVRAQAYVDPQSVQPYLRPFVQPFAQPFDQGRQRSNFCACVGCLILVGLLLILFAFECGEHRACQLPMFSELHYPHCMHMPRSGLHPNVDVGVPPPECTSHSHAFCWMRAYCAQIKSRRTTGCSTCSPTQIAMQAPVGIMRSHPSTWLLGETGRASALASAVGFRARRRREHSAES